MKQVDNFYNVTTLAWKPDGSKLCVGGMTGTVDIYDACVRRHKYKVGGGAWDGTAGGFRCQCLSKVCLEWFKSVFTNRDPRYNSLHFIF